MRMPYSPLHEHVRDHQLLTYSIYPLLAPACTLMGSSSPTRCRNDRPSPVTRLSPLQCSTLEGIHPIIACEGHLQQNCDESAPTRSWKWSSERLVGSALVRRDLCLWQLQLAYDTWSLVLISALTCLWHVITSAYDGLNMPTTRDHLCL